MAPKLALAQRRFTARADALDFRDRMFEPTLVEVPPERPLDLYLKRRVPVLDQGSEGACTGFGLATVAHYLLRSRGVAPDTTRVSARMLYELARRHDEWRGEDYDGSSARGAMKGWHKHGCCSEAHWRYDGEQDEALFAARWTDALRRPLGSYFRVNHRDLVAMHAAITETGILYATATVHEGWDAVPRSGIIRQSERALGGHAFAIVGYDADGFWIQNSWGRDWGKGGFARIAYDDWLANGTDVWVARLGAPVRLTSPASTAATWSAASAARGMAHCDLRPHVVSLGNDGRLRAGGAWGTDADDVRRIFEQDLPRVTAGWARKRVLLYAHGGLVPEDTAIQRLADYRTAMLDAEVYPVSFIWKTDFWSTLGNVLRDALGKRRPEGILDKAKDFMLDRLDDALEPLARTLTGKLLWDEMKENARLASAAADGGMRVALHHLVAFLRANPDAEVHVAAHSAGSILMAPAIQLLAGQAIGKGALARRAFPVATCTLWAPACTTELFRGAYAPAIVAGHVDRFALFTLTDKAERDDHCANVYHKSLLYLVSNAFEAKPRIPAFRDGVPILGMEKFVREDRTLRKLFADFPHRVHHVRSPNEQPVGDPGASRATSHGAFDDDVATLKATLLRITGVKAGALPSALELHPSAAGQRVRRERLV